MKDLLPLGTVLTVENGTKRIMVIGRLQRAVGTDDIYDYAAILWPEGYIDSKHIYLFNQENVHCLYHIGLQDTIEFSYRYTLEEEYEKMHK